MNRRLGWEIERIILAVIIVLGLLDFAGILPPFLAYMMDIIGWTTIAYILYVVSPTEIIFGERHSTCDFGIVLSYVVMSIKDLIGNAAATLPQLMAAAPSYVVFKIANVTNPIPFTITEPELNAFTYINHAVPERVVAAIAPHLTMSQQQIPVLLVHESTTIGLQAFPTGFNGMMLMYYNSLVQNAAIIQKLSLLIGFTVLLSISIYAAYRIPVRKPSVLFLMKEEGAAKPSRIFWVFLLLVGFFVMVFNLLFEWMTITNDAPLLALAVLVFGTLFLIHHLHLSFDEMIDHLGSLGDEFYVKVVHLFMESRTVLLGISGFLVLHLLTDVGNYVAPSIFGWYQTIYVQNTPGNHTPLYRMMVAAMTGDLTHNALIVATYVLSTIGIILLLSLPAIIWYKIFKLRTTGSHDHLPDWKGWQVGMIMGCIVVFLIAPVFEISALRGTEIVGVNITSLPANPDLAIIALAAGATIFLFCAVLGALHDYVRRVLMLAPFAAAAIFFGIYVYTYFTSSFLYYATVLVELLQRHDFWVIPIILIIFILTIIFFVTGFLSFLYEIWRD